MIGHSQADGLALGVHQAARRLAGGGQNERVGSRGVRAQDPVDRV